MAGVFFGLMIGLELKHYIADYFLQPGWMLAGKGNFFHAGGYVHAGIHAGLSLLVLLLVGTPIGLSLALVAAEFALHYGLDYAKIHYSSGVHVENRPRRFWVLHGVDQVAHQLTYVATIFVVVKAQGLV
jgi:hypothetical protein